MLARRGRAMLFPVLLILIPSILIVVLARWAKTDEDDWVRKLIVSLVQLSCLLCMALGVMKFAQRSADGPPPPEEAPVASTPTSSTSGVVRVTPLGNFQKPPMVTTDAERIAAERKAEEDRVHAEEARKEWEAPQTAQRQQAFDERARRAAERNAPSSPTPNSSGEPALPPSGVGSSGEAPPTTSQTPPAEPPAGSG